MELQSEKMICQRVKHDDFKPFKVSKYSKMCHFCFGLSSCSHKVMDSGNDHDSRQTQLTSKPISNVSQKSLNDAQTLCVSHNHFLSFFFCFHLIRFMQLKLTFMCLIYHLKKCFFPCQGIKEMGRQVHSTKYSSKVTIVKD